MSIPKAPPPSLRLRLDTQALADNWRALDKMSGAAEAGAAVKADAYGLGIDRVVPVLVKAGARQFFVAHWGEAVDLMAHVPAGSIAVLHGPCTDQEAAFARETGVIPVINSLQQAQIWRDSGGGACHLMVDTGMNRLGVSEGELGEDVLASLDIDFAMSHLASADEDSPMNGEQLQRFHEASRNISAKRLSLANSAGIGLGTDYGFDLTRPGLSLYGGVPRENLANRITQVAYPQASIIQTREVMMGEKIGYNATYTAPRKMIVATVTIGYGDGLLRCWAGEGALQHQGYSLPILGRISMDMISVDISNVPSLKVGHLVDFPYELRSSSLACGLSQYELLTCLGSRF